MADPLSRVFLVGITEAGAAGLIPQAHEAIERAEVIAGGDRNLAFFPEHAGRRIRIGADAAEAVREIVHQADAGRQVTVLASGDPFLFGIGPLLVKALGRDRLEVLPNVSAIQLAFARLGEPWQGAAVLSAHGRPLCQLVPRAMNAQRMAILTDDHTTPGAIGEALTAAGMEDCRAVVAEHLGGPREQLFETTLYSLPGKPFDRLNVLLLLRKPGSVRLSFGQQDERFESARGQITKAEVRAVTLSKLALCPNGILWDVGAGSGALAVEAAHLMPSGRVFAVERDPEQQEIIERNVARHGASNVELVRGEAPQTLADLPAPDAVFLGGSGGRLSELLDVLPRPFVANLSVLEHLQLILQRFPKAEVIQLSISRAAPLAGGRHLTALNPVYVTMVPADD